MTRPVLLDLFCGAGGAAMGYHRAGFDVVGVDIAPQPHYPFTFVQGDALEYLAAHGSEFDAIHASPPCQKYSTIAKQVTARYGKQYPDLVDKTRAALILTGKPFVIENVKGAPLRFAFQLCGSSFGLNVRRHRLFETGNDFQIMLTPPCSHVWQTPRFRSLDHRRKSNLSCVVGVHGHLNYPGEGELRKAAMGIDWMSQDELAESIPPAYTQFIGAHLIQVITAAR